MGETWIEVPQIWQNLMLPRRLSVYVPFIPLLFTQIGKRCIFFNPFNPLMLPNTKVQSDPATLHYYYNVFQAFKYGPN